MFSASLLIHNLLVLLLLSGERYILETYSSIPDHSLASFLFLITIASAFHSLGLSINEWMRPQLFDKLRNQRTTRQLYRNTTAMMLVLFSGFVIIGWPILQIIAAPKTVHFTLLNHFLPLSLSQLLFTLAFMIDLRIVYAKRYRLLLAASAIAVAATVFGYFIWDGLNQVTGVIYSNLFAASILCAAMLIFSNRVIRHEQQ